MMITDEEVKDLKTWIIKSLEDISDADSDVLADYVLALIRADAPEPELRANAVENLEDFLRDNTAKFVDDIFRTLQTKEYLPGYVAPPKSATIPTANASAGLAVPRGPRDAGNQQVPQQSRKRSYNDSLDGPKGHDAHYGQNERQMKQLRRGGMGAINRGGFRGSSREFNGHQPMQQHNLALPGMPTPPPGLPFDPNDPMAAILAIQALGIPMPMPGPGVNPQFSPAMPGQSKAGGGKTKINARCRDYDNKGICNRGVNCPFIHDENQIIVSPSQEEYDPKNSSMIDVSTERRQSNGHSQSEGLRGRGRGRGRGDRGGGGPRRSNRADFSQAGPNHDRSITTVVVEQIPEENFNEQAVRDFFYQFGTINEVTMQPYKRLALVKYDDYRFAQAAYESPKVIFDNRFVKVYWYNPNTVPTPTNGRGNHNDSAPVPKPEEPAFDREKFERDAEAAQKRLEERKALQLQNEAKIAELAKQKEELARKQAEEKRKLEEKLRAKGESLPVEMAVDSGDKKTSSNTEALRAQLKALEDEAKSLGIDPEPWASTRGRGRGRGRGSYRGWEAFAGRGAYDPSRGSTRARGSYRGSVRAGGAYNLDNRPKKVKLTGVVFDNDKDEALKQHLFSVGEYTSTEPSDDKSYEVVTFKDRFTAETFFRGPKDIPGVGKLEFAWVSSPLPPVAVPWSAKDADTVMGDAEGDAEGTKLRGGELIESHDQREVDYDVAEDDDRWIS